MMFRGLSLLLMVLFSLSANAAEIKVTSDRDPVALDESFTLTFETEEKVDGDPDFTPLERDFQIRTRSKSSSIQWVNGRKTSKESWILTVMARKKGTLTVPPIRFGDDISTILKINVTNTVQPQKKGGDAAIFLEVSADRESVYLQAQLLYTVRFYTAKRIMDYTLSEPTFSTGSAIIKKLGDDYQFETMRGGHRYVVVERRYAIFPQTTGKLELEPILFEGQILTGRQSTLQLFNQQLQIKRVRSEGISVDVKPIPASFSGKEWFPANRVTFDSEWLSKEFRVGEPVTRKLKIEAVGVDAKLIPVLSKDRKVSGIKIYPDQPQLEDSIGSGGLIGSRLESIAVIPTKEGKLVLPEIKLVWWDVDEDRQRVETIPQMVVNVLPSTDTAPLLPPQPQQINQQSNDESQIQSTPVEDGVTPFWRWLSYLLGAGWIITALMWWLHARTMRLGFDGAIVETRKSDKGPSRRSLEKRLKKACQNDDPRAVEDALLEWAEVVWQRDPPSNLTEMAESVDDEFAEQLERLNRAIYANDGGEWHGELWDMAKSFRLRKAVMEREVKKEPLRKLYPQ
ncbi:MAG: BatD family protein [Gammaproteobacteria bacterium]|nr:BatD family protein [Gammaproteobacteria bacterium]